MKQLVAKLSMVTLLSQAFVAKAFAQLEPPPDIPGLQGDDTDLQQAIVDVIKVVLDFVLLIAVIFVIVAGLRLIISGGDEGEKDKAKKTIIYVIVGIIVVLFARVIVTFVGDIFSES